MPKTQRQPAATPAPKASPQPATERAQTAQELLAKIAGVLGPIGRRYPETMKYWKRGGAQ